MKKSLQSIQDFYEKQGYKGAQLRRMIENDKEWREIVKDRNRKLSKRVSLTKSEKTKYVMSTDEDYEILDKIKQLEKLMLKKEDRYFIKFLRTQLEHDWRKPILAELNKLLRKYKNNL